MKKGWYVFGLMLLLSGCSSSNDNDENSTLAPYFNDADKQVELLSTDNEELNENQEELFYQVARGSVETIHPEVDMDGFDDYSLYVKKVKGKGKYKINYIVEDVLDGSQYKSEMTITLKSEDLEDDSKFKITNFTSDFDNWLSTESSSEFNSSSSWNDQSDKTETSDITQLSPQPSSEQISILDNLADQQFKEDYPYKGSKIHKVLGLIQDWTTSDDEWYYKAEATIVNENGAERKVNVEIYIAPTGSQTGVVSIVAY